ncbi:MAG TPA: hypothetical protein VFJ15_11305 [Oleiagrimonas sp.]|nr:hypothetical protein [Oleiagrimonas sp.]
MQVESKLWTGLRGILAVLYTVVVALALGAVWMALSMRVYSAHTWFAVVAGLAMGYATRAWITRRRYAGMVLAVAGTFLAMVYMACLRVGLILAAIMGLGYVHTLKTAGIDMLLALARNTLDVRVLVATLIGMALAAWVTWRRGSRQKHAELTHRVP